METLLTEILAGDALSLSQAAKLLPGHRGAATLNAATTWRWAAQGVKTPSGVVVRLEAARVGGRWLTSKAAIARFMSALSAPGEQPAEKPRTPTQARKAAKAAGDRLAAAGW